MNQILKKLQQNKDNLLLQIQNDPEIEYNEEEIKEYQENIKKYNIKKKLLPENYMIMQYHK